MAERTQVTDTYNYSLRTVLMSSENRDSHQVKWRNDIVGQPWITLEDNTIAVDNYGWLYKENDIAVTVSPASNTALMGSLVYV
jgi:hypothetical protein